MCQTRRATKSGLEGARRRCLRSRHKRAVAKPGSYPALPVHILFGLGGGGGVFAAMGSSAVIQLQRLVDPLPFLLLLFGKRFLFTSSSSFYFILLVGWEFT